MPPSAELASRIKGCLRLERQLEPDLGALLPEDGREERLRGEAEAISALKHSGTDLPFHGLVAGVKDVFHVRGTITQLGENDVSIPCLEEAEVVSILREQGALILGKVQTTPFTYFTPARTKNPRAPCRAIRQEAQAVDPQQQWLSAFVISPLVRVGIPSHMGLDDARQEGPTRPCEKSPSSLLEGRKDPSEGLLSPPASQICGSISRPAAFCGTVGFKPSHGRVSDAGLVTCSPSLDQVGWLARDVETARLAAQALVKDWTDHDGSALEGPLRLGVPQFNSDHPQQDASCPLLQKCTDQTLQNFKSTLKKLENSGKFKLVRFATSPLANLNQIVSTHLDCMAYEYNEAFKKDGLLTAKTSLPDALKELLRKGQGLTQSIVEAATASRLSKRSALDGKMKELELDALVYPATASPPPALFDGTTGSAVLSIPWSHAGMPTVTVPTLPLEHYSAKCCCSGKASLPMAITLVGGYHEDEKLLRVAKVVEACNTRLTEFNV